MQQAVAFARRAQLGGPGGRGRQGIAAQFVEAVEVLGAQPHRLAVAGELRGLPRRLDAPEAAGDVRVRCVQQTLHGVRRRTGGPQIGADVVVEQILQDVRSVVQPLRLPFQMFMGVDQRRLLNVPGKIGSHRSSPPP